MKTTIELLQASRYKATRQRDNWKRRALAYQAAMMQAAEMLEAYEELTSGLLTLTEMLADAQVHRCTDAGSLRPRNAPIMAR